MRKVIIETPYKAHRKDDRERFDVYARRAIRQILDEGDAPVAFHMLYTQEGIYEDNNEEQREAGIKASQVWYQATVTLMVFTDYGLSEGMIEGILLAQSRKMPIVYRAIGKNHDDATNDDIPF